MAKTNSPTPAENDSTKKELDRCKELSIKIQRELGPRAEYCCIYRVPKRLREVQKMAYNLRLVSIGPFLHPRELKNMEKKKRHIFLGFSVIVLGIVSRILDASSCPKKIQSAIAIQRTLIILAVKNL
ncbi:hypothetical protein I3760_15G061500 [Carya illinoinensis]|nr:hypothetical protein I3760_15G061500 [Carya illinoinensis]